MVGLLKLILEKNVPTTRSRSMPPSERLRRVRLFLIVIVPAVNKFFLRFVHVSYSYLEIKPISCQEGVKTYASNSFFLYAISFAYRNSCNKRSVIT